MIVDIYDFEDRVGVVELDGGGITRIEAGVLSLEELLNDIRKNGVVEMSRDDSEYEDKKEADIDDGFKSSKITTDTVNLLIRDIERSGPYEAVIRGQGGE